MPEISGVVFVTGHRGMVGSSVVRALNKLETVEILVADKSDLDLSEQSSVRDFFNAHKIDHVVLSAAKVGGILANDTFPAEFIYQNLMIQSNVIHFAHQSDVQNLLFLGSSCIYPKMAPQPILESSLMNGQLEPTNEPYAISKIAGIKQCESYNRQYGRNYRCIMPTNLYGPNDNFHPTESHVLPGLMRRFHEAVMRQDEEVVVWGSGNPRREFLHVDDLASACIFLMSLDQDKLDNNVKPMQSHINIGTGVDNSISEISRKISEVTGYDGKIRFDNSKPDGTPRKILDVSLINKLGWESSIELDRGLARTYEWFLENFDLLRG